MDLLEHIGKQRCSARRGSASPRGAVASTAEEAAGAAADLGGSVVIKAQVPAGKRGKAGAIRFADDPRRAQAAADALLGKQVNGYAVSEVLVEEQVDIARELYAAVLVDPAPARARWSCSRPRAGWTSRRSTSAPEAVLRCRWTSARASDADASRGAAGGRRGAVGRRATRRGEHARRALRSYPRSTPSCSRSIRW